MKMQLPYNLIICHESILKDNYTYPPFNPDNRLSTVLSMKRSHWIRCGNVEILQGRNKKVEKNLQRCDVSHHIKDREEERHP